MRDWDDSCGPWTHHHRGQTVTPCVRQCLDTCLPFITHLLRRIVVSHDNDHDDKGNVYLRKNQRLMMTCLVSGRWVLFCPSPISISRPTSTWNHRSNIVTELFLWTFLYHGTFFENCRFSLPFLEVIILGRNFFQTIKLFSSDFIITKMSDQWQEFRCNGTVGEVGQNKVNSVDLGDLIKTWTENIDF